MAQKEVKGWDKVVAWYAKHAYAVNMVYSGGASIVIIGALFKIMHWPFAGTILTIGMMTEALLFGIGIFEKPHAVYNWENVFPQLRGKDGEVPLMKEDDNKAPTLEEKEMKMLKESIANVAKSANDLAELGKLAEGTNKLSDKLAAATKATEQFVGAEEGLANGTAQAAEAAAQLGESYAASAAAVQAAARSNEETAKSAASAVKSADAVAQHLNALSAAFELQLKAVQSGQKEADAYEAAMEKLNKQIADLNKIYGNMLSALA